MTAENVSTLPRDGSAALTPRAPARRGHLCIVVPSISTGEGTVIARNLRRHGNQQALVLTRHSEARELVQLLAGGVRGAVAVEPGADVALVARNSPDPDDPARRVSEREVSVLRLVAEGQSNREIGAALGLSALTIKSHLARISRKLGTGDRAALVAVAIRSGLI